MILPASHGGVEAARDAVLVHHRTKVYGSLEYDAHVWGEIGDAI